MGFRRFREPFLPLLGGCVEIPFGDLPALEKALRAKPAAFLVEPIQAEAGVLVPAARYLAEAARLCRKAGTLLVLDEVQTGIGRTGELFAFRAEKDFVPDVLVLGKSLGGSILPVSVAMTTREHQQRAYGTAERFDLHGSTFSGYAIGCRAAIETLKILDEEKLPERARELGEYALGALRRRLGEHPLVRDVRGRGLLIGIELGPSGRGLWAKVQETLSVKVFGQWLALRLLEVGILCQPASQQWNVLRLEPPLVVTREEIDRVIDAIDAVLREYESIGPLVADVGKRIGAQAMGGWEFR
jgi:putrescine aminotransferase